MAVAPGTWATNDRVTSAVQAAPNTGPTTIQAPTDALAGARSRPALNPSSVPFVQSGLCNSNRGQKPRLKAPPKLSRGACASIA
jgi:hypothetical protein